MSTRGNLTRSCRARLGLSPFVAKFIVRGVRNTGDFEFEKAIARTNRFLSRIETIFILTSAKTSFISSSIVRDLINNNGDYSKLVPESISDFVLKNHSK